MVWNFFPCGKWRGYKNFLVSNRSTSGVDSFTQDEYENVTEGDMDLGKKSYN